LSNVSLSAIFVASTTVTGGTSVALASLTVSAGAISFSEPLDIKTCRTCKLTKPRDGFHADRTHVDGLCTSCKACRLAKSIARRAANGDAMRERDKSYYAKNREKLIVLKRGYEAKARDLRRAEGRTLRRNVERERKRFAWYYPANAETFRARARQWSRDNRERATAHSQNRRMRKMSAPGRGISGDEWLEITASTCGICSYCGERRTLSLDHIDPLTLGGEHDVENAAAVCRPCNSSKRSKPLLLWLVHRAQARSILSQRAVA
jgi:5-methylcytosine-specific restriction endonuclease McrA